MHRLIAALVVACAIASSASAQIFYEPVRYQYGGQTPWYYGGSDPEMFRAAEIDHAQARDGYAMVTGNVLTHRAVTYSHPSVYVDALPRGNAAPYGYTPTDARNAAYANAARYFCKRDALRQAAVDADGALHVSPNISCERPSGTIEIKPYVQPASAPNRVFIFPKGLLDRKLTNDAKPSVASAQ